MNSALQSHLKFSILFPFPFLDEGNFNEGLVLERVVVAETLRTHRKYSR